MSKQQVLNPWTPIELISTGNKIETHVWGRKYECGDKSFIEKITSQNQEILAEPVRIVGVENGKEIVWGNFHNFIMDDSDDATAVICSAAECKSFILNTSLSIEFDGCVDMSLSIMPIGRNPKQNLGFGGFETPHFNLTKLWIEIPLKPEIAKYYHIHPNAPLTVNGEQKDENVFSQADMLPQEIAMPFREQIYISNDDVGFAFFGESDKGIQTEDENRVIECIKEENCTLLRIRLLDNEPIQWKVKGTANGQDLFPITYRFGWIATPIKKFPENPYSEKNLHFMPPENYVDFLLGQYKNTDEITLDRIKRLGVNTLYIHEKWNDIQNSPFLTRNTAEKIKKLVEAAHKRDIKVIPYFGYEISSLSPYWSKLGTKIMQKGSENNYAVNWIWYRQPPQRDIYLCYNSEWQDMFVDGIKNLLDTFDFDGIYIDGMMYPKGCMNEEHGCGYRDDNGKLHITYPLWAIRSLMKKLYTAIDGRGGIINNHGGGAFNLSSMSFCHSIWEGEVIQSKFMHGEITELPENHFRSVFTGRNYGVPVNMLCYKNEPKWYFSQGVAVSIPFGILPKPINMDELDYMSALWEYIDKFPVEDAVWHPYYENHIAIKSSDDNVKISYYQAGNRKLLFCANVVNKPTAVDIMVGNPKYNLVSSFSDNELSFTNGVITTQLDGFGYCIITLEEN